MNPWPISGSLDGLYHLSLDKEIAVASSSTSSSIGHPEDLTAVSSSYRLRVWMALLGLFLFVLLYIGLASWFTYTTYRMVRGIFNGGDEAFRSLLVAIPAGFLSIFMWKAIFFIRPGAANPGKEITAENQPALFKFLHELADETKAPRPHKVFLSPDVNAAVFYDLSVLNFFIPTRKNLLIGLGLVNVLNRTEFKAVLAHEFGHFSQRSMAVSKWVYVGKAIAGHIIAKRDILDRMLEFISRIDLRLAWIGWVMRLIVWSIRSLMESVFTWVILAERSLSREMEFHADLVAVSVSGSDALIHALYRIHSADQSWTATTDFVISELVKGKAVEDLFAVQTLIDQHFGRILNQPLYGQPPQMSGDNPANHRVFSASIAQPPRMWMTHPPNTEREENAKRTYIPAPIDEQSAWTLFDDPEGLRKDVTQQELERFPVKEKAVRLTFEEAKAELEKTYSRESFDNRYQGVYLGRRVTLAVDNPQELYGEFPRQENLIVRLNALYPVSLRDQVEEYRRLDDEVGMLQAIEQRYYDAPEGEIRYRGRVIPPGELPELIKEVESERKQILGEIEAFDRECRTMHLAAAEEVGHGWKAYLESLGGLLHYAEHSEVNLKDAADHLFYTTQILTAGGRISSWKLKMILSSANDLQQVMSRLNHQASQISLPPAILTELEAESWRDALEKCDLPPADEENIGQWLQVIESWVSVTGNALSSLRVAVLDELLNSEKHVAECLRESREAEAAPAVATLPATYSTLIRGQERPREQKLDWWSRFTLADGWGYSAARFAIAATLVASVVIAGLYAGDVNLTIYNGLSIPVEVHVNHREVTVDPHDWKKLSVSPGENYQITAKSPAGEIIEEFEEDMDQVFSDYVYNIAAAAPMVEWTAVYGSADQVPADNLGARRFWKTTADHIFTDPPEQVSTKSGSAKHTVLTGYSQENPLLLLGLVTNPADHEQIIRAHARWDTSDSRYINSWLTRAGAHSGFPEIIEGRLNSNPGDVATLRMVQELAEGEQREMILEVHQRIAAEHPNDPDWQYIGIRALSDGPEQDRKFLEAHARWSDHNWLCNAVGFIHAQQGEWENSLRCFEKILSRRDSLYDSAAMNVVLLRRLISGSDQVRLDGIGDSMEVMQLLSLESGEGIRRNDAGYGYTLLAQNRLKEAYDQFASDQSDRRLMILIAASEGAKPEWRRQALTLPVTDDLDPKLALYQAAIAYREGKSPESYIDLAKKFYAKAELSPVTFLERFIEQQSPGSLETEALNGLNLDDRGRVYAIACVMFPDEQQEEWKKYATALLFVSERPAL